MPKAVSSRRWRVDVRFGSRERRSWSDKGRNTRKSDARREREWGPQLPSFRQGWAGVFIRRGQGEGDNIRYAEGEGKWDCVAADLPARVTCQCRATLEPFPQLTHLAFRFWRERIFSLRLESPQGEIVCTTRSGHSLQTTVTLLLSEIPVFVTIATLPNFSRLPLKLLLCILSLVWRICTGHDSCTIFG